MPAPKADALEYIEDLIELYAEAAVKSKQCAAALQDQTR